MQAGRLRHLVTIQAPGTARDTFGQPIVGWSDFATVWADIRFLKGVDEARRSDVVVSSATCSIRIRVLAGVSAKMRVVNGADHYNIQSILQDPTGRRYLDLICEVGANDG